MIRVKFALKLAHNLFTPHAVYLRPEGIDHHYPIQYAPLKAYGIAGAKSLVIVSSFNSIVAWNVKDYLKRGFMERTHFTGETE